MIYVITAGHSNTDPGAVAGKRKEADIAVAMRNLVAAALRAKGYEVLTDGEGLENQDLNRAIALVKRATACAVEFHMNASANPAATGVETISLPKDKALSQRISAVIAGVLGLKLRGDKGWIDQSQSARGRLGYVNAGGLIVELCFLSNPQELAKLDASMERVAEAIAGAL